jgi:phosphoglycerate kinase
MKIIDQSNIRGKKVFLRVDFNVPMKNGVIVDNNRIKAAIPTIKFLVGEKAKIIIGTHCGRPKGKSSPETSIAPIAKELQRLLNLKVAMAEQVIGVEVDKLAKALQPGGILVLENLRWDKGEEEDDTLFAQELAGLAEVYVNDAFAVSHRANASVHAITNFLPSYGGFLMRGEIEHLSNIKDKPLSPFVLIIGGVKVDDKAGMIERLAPKADKILLGGGVANTFLKANGQEVSKSAIDEAMVEDCKKMLAKYKKKIVLPSDYISEDVEGGYKIMDLGRQTIEQYAEIIKRAKTVFWNGSLGYSEDARYQTGMKQVAMAMNAVIGTTVIAGGDTVGFVKHEKLDKNITFISTGGGAALEFLAGKKLPGIEALG